MNYIPDSPPPDIKDLPKYLYEELNRLAAVIQIGEAKSLEQKFVAPLKPREGMIAFADGTSWNPGLGKGVYVYYAAAWNKL